MHSCSRSRSRRPQCSRWWSHIAPRAKPPIAEPQAAEPAKPIELPRLVVNNYSPVSSLIEFAAGALKRQSGAAIEFDDFYLEHCNAKNARALAPAEAVAQTNELCRECGITIQRKGLKRFLADVQLSVA